MEALLPSEIARLVFGYLEDQKCDEAARSFLTASPHLHECRTAVLNGRRFSTRVNGYTLVDIFDKYFAAHSLVQERLGKVADCEQVRQCGDLLEQLRFLIGGSRGQRFVVNINVPSQANSQTYGGSPLISSSVRKRHYSSSDRDRSKRTHKTLNQLFEKQPEPVSSQLGSETVEATPLESLPGHTNPNVPHQHESAATQDSDGLYCTSTKNDFVDCPPISDAPSLPKDTCPHSGLDQDNSSGRSERYSPDPVLNEEKTNEGQIEDEKSKNSTLKGKTTATSTDELTTYSSIEVQTTPYALSEAESNELDDEPIENLSLLTKELLNRTELQERIAENINKAILPMDIPSKDESICESVGGELNTSIMAELNNAIKSIVAATETDPIFEHFLDEIIGPNIDTDTSPDEDPDSKGISELPTNSRIPEEPSNTAVVDMELEKETEVISGKSLSSSGTLEVPLKQRLRSSSRQQNNKPEDEGDKPKEIEKTDNSLEDHNAAAILSIINANIVSDKQAAERSGIVGNSAALKPAAVEEPTKLSQAAPVLPETQVADSTELVENDRMASKGGDKLFAKKSDSAKSDSESKVAEQRDVITEQEIMAMPTLIVCSQEEINDCMKMNNFFPAGTILPCPEARFVPIAPKVSDQQLPVKPLCLRAVQVPVQVQKKIQPSVVGKLDRVKTKSASPFKMLGGNRRNRKVTKKRKNLKPAVVSTSVVVDSTEPLLTQNEQQQQPPHTELESITLYANDNSFGTMIETGHMPSINLDDSMALTGAGLSPYLKFHDNKNILQEPDLPCEKPPGDQIPVEGLNAGVNKADESLVLPHAENILITRRTPKSLLKSRSKNNRLSMSTPRRRSSHIRALDFNTPMKSSSSEQKFGANKSAQFSPKSSKRVKSVCRTSLFKSPPFSSSFNTSQKVRTPVKDRQLYKVPIATRSPAPKLMGGWEIHTGVGMILGGTSPHPSSTSSVFEREEIDSSSIKPLPSSSGGIKKSWDADLRKALQEHQQQPSCSTAVAKKVSAKVKGRAGKNSNANCAEKISKSESSENSNHSEHVDTVEQKIAKNITKRDAGDSREAEVVSRVKNSDRKTAEISKQVDKIGESELGSEVPSGKTEIVKDDGELKTRLNLEIDMNKPKDKPVVKKYAKLKTLDTKISKYKEKDLLECTAAPICSVDSGQKRYEFLKVSPESQNQPVHMQRIVDLETPRKTDSSTGIPATPRVLSPSSSTITPFTKITEELSKVPSFVNTPDFPPTPSIALTPKVLGEDTIDAIKKGEFSTCSPYYQPSNEQPDILEKLISGSTTTQKDNSTKVLPIVASLANLDSSAVITTSEDIAGDFAMSLSTSKLEITQFEVIKENLPKEEADKEFKISGSSKNSEDILPRLKNPATGVDEEPSEAVNIDPRPSHNDDSNSASGIESSDSSSSDTSSSSSCSSSCSCSSIATTSTPFKSATKCKKQSNAYKDSSNDCTMKNLPSFANTQNLLSEISPIVAHDVYTAPENNQALNPMPIVPIEETSPLKMMPLIKTQEEVEASLKETPAKDEALLSEANISETPSSSKSGIECLTNLNSKISALDSQGEQSTSRQNHSATKVPLVHSHTRLKPKIISVQNLSSDISVVDLKPSLLTEIVSSTTQTFSSLSTLSSVTSDGKLGSHLEEKRLRLMAKLKTKSHPKVIPQKMKVKSSVKTNCKDKNEPLQSRERKTSVSQVAPHNPPAKKDAQVPEQKRVRLKNTNLKPKQKGNSLNDVNAKITQAKPTLVKLPTKERNNDKCTTLQTGVEKTANFRKGKKITKTEDQDTIQKKEQPNRRVSSEISDPGSVKPDSKKCETEPPINTKEVIRDIKAVNSAADSASAAELCDPMNRRNSTEQTNKEEKSESASNIPISVKKNQMVLMSKVDQIKRDLFSDEENSDQRTTRSRTRQLSDAQKNEPAISTSVPVSQTDEVSESGAKKPKEELANVLECLKLVPANKTETANEIPSDIPKDYINESGHYVCFFDDSAPVKKKKKEKKKFVPEEVEYSFEIEDDEDKLRVVIAVTDYEELFNISPKPKKRVVTKKLGAKGSKSVKTEASKPTSITESILKKELLKPPATSSAAAKPKTTMSRTGKTTGKDSPQKSGKQTDQDEKKKPKDSNPGSQKRKVTESEDDQQSDQMTGKKRRIADPQTLLKKLDLDLFLTSVHGPV